MSHCNSYCVSSCGVDTAVRTRSPHTHQCMHPRARFWAAHPSLCMHHGCALRLLGCRSCFGPLRLCCPIMRLRFHACVCVCVKSCPHRVATLSQFHPCETASLCDKGRHTAIRSPQRCMHRTHARILSHVDLCSLCCAAAVLFVVCC